MALICYLAIFGVSYMTSGTSAYFSNQSEVPQMITAGTWEDSDGPINAVRKMRYLIMRSMPTVKNEEDRA